MGQRKMVTGSAQYNRNTKLIGKIIKDNKYDLDSYDRVQT